MLTDPTVTSVTIGFALSPHERRSASRTPRRESATSNATQARPHTATAETRHTYDSLCIAAGTPPLEISRFMGHSKITTTLSIYSHLFPSGSHRALTALAAMNAPVAANVVAMRRRG
jgi:integrase